MAQITAAMVKALRERSQAGMMECKKALQAADGDIEQALTDLRKSGKIKAAKRAGKTAAEGTVVIAASPDHKKAFMVEVNSETDFVGRDESFLAFAKSAAEAGLAGKIQTVEALSEAGLAEGSVEDKRQTLVHQLGENIQLRRVEWLESTGCVAAYSHGSRIGVLVALDVDQPELGKDIAMHIAAMNPQAIDESALSKAVIEKEREIFIAQVKDSGKPDNIIEKMVDGRIQKFMKETCLVSQPFVRDTSQTVGQLLAAKQATVQAFIRFEVGEGIEKETVDFAEEVKAQVKGSE